MEGKSNLPVVKLSQGVHVMHLFHRVDRLRWAQLGAGESAAARGRLEALCAANANPSHPRLVTFANVSGKADLVFLLQAAELGQVAQLHRDLESCFEPGLLSLAFSFLSVTELSEYLPTEEDNRKLLVEEEKLQPGSAQFKQRVAELARKRAELDEASLYPRLPDWEVMGFHPMSKRRVGDENWYRLDFSKRKQLVEGHARVERKFAGRVVEMVTASTGLEEWERGVTLVAHQVDALKESVYERHFDELGARYSEFGPFFINLRLEPAALWKHLHL